MDFSNKFNELSQLVESWLPAGAGGGELLSTTVRDAARYAIFSGGKRVRPVLTLLTAEMLDVEIARLKSFVLALELIHTSSLIHDDLPALDNDDVRRGRPTCHRVYGEGAAVIAGDLLIARAFERIALAPETAGVRAAWSQLLAEATVALCDGQGLDLELSGAGNRARLEALPPEEQRAAVLACHRRKTAALFRASVLGPAELSSWGGSGDVRNRLAALGEAIGLLFQLTDDLLDAGPGPGAAPGAFSSISAMGREGVERAAEERLQTILELTGPFGQKAGSLRELVRSIGIRKS